MRRPIACRADLGAERGGSARPSRRSGRRPAFTLVEILIVVILLAIISSIVVPQYWDMTKQAATTNLKENLSKIRGHIQVYRNQHARYPDGATFAGQMTQSTNFQGDVAAARDETHIYGPYIEQMPANPVSNLRLIRHTSDPAARFSAPSSDGGWWYNEITGEFYADLTDERVDENGERYNRF